MIDSQPQNDDTISGSKSGQSVPLTPTKQSVSSIPGQYPLVLSHTPGGSEEWVRRVERQFMPSVGKVFPSLDEAISFYRAYAFACGFTPRLYTSRHRRGFVLKNKILVCNRQGFRENPQKLRDPSCVESKKVRRRKVKITRVGCKASINFCLVDGAITVVEFHESHNHRLFSANERDFEKVSRDLTLFHKQLIVDHLKLNIGASKSFRICKEYVNGYSNVGASLLDFKNFQRDIKCFIGEKDAQLFIDRFQMMSESKRGFFFSYHVDDSTSLSRVFWSDAEAIRNYSLFGDAISFDPTYGTNKYSMVFTPFTGVDHHKKSVFFGACLLSNEDENSFRWCFEKFLEAMGQKEPQIIITDQDPAIKKAVQSVFVKARHRFCIWHIMEKLNDKVGSSICRDTDFLSRLHSIVWDAELDPSDFEQKWIQVINDFEMGDHSWLSSMFSLRQFWIPAYHRDLPMGCVLRTTQRSESQNSFFKRYENHFGTLVEFWMRFQTALDQQRYSQRCADNDSDHALPILISPLPLELHASRVYTHPIFYEFQEEVKASISSCSVAGFTKNNEEERTDVEDAERNKTYQVVFYVATKDASCTCKLFERKGILCRHVIWVYSGKRFQSIPEKYILSRWTKNAIRQLLFDADGNVVEDNDPNPQTHLAKLWSEIHATVSVLKTVPDIHTQELCGFLVQFREGICPKAQELTKEQELEMLLGCSSTSTISILPPSKSNNKGSGKRLISTKAQCIEKAEKPKRLCAYCKEMGSHDRRNCAVRIADETAAKKKK